MGSALLLALCVLSLVAGIRRRSTESARNDEVEPWVRNGACSPTMRANRGLARRVDLRLSQLPAALVLSSPFEKGQLRVAAAFGAISVAATVVVAFLLAGQIQRAAPITSFGMLLGGALVAVPSALSLHLALRRFHVRLTPQRLSVIRREGLLRADAADWAESEVDSVRFVESACGAAVLVIIEVRGRHLEIPFWGLRIDQVDGLLGGQSARDIGTAGPLR